MLLNIEKLVYGGDGLARDEGRVVLLPFVLPGEQVEADVHRAKNDLLRGEVRGIVSPAEHRVEPGCPYFYRCGGCQYQHIEYSFQVEQKVSILREVLRRLGKIEFDSGIQVFTGEPWQYRNRMQLHIDNGAIGYFEFGSHRLCPIDQCPISSPKLNETIGRLARELARVPNFQTTIELFTNETGVQFNTADRVPPLARAMLDEIGTTMPIEYGGFLVSRNSFFQVNRFLIEKLADAATADARGASAIDLYAGVGLFTLALARRFQMVTAVELGNSAYRDLEFNVQRARVPVNVVNMDAEAFLTDLKETPDLILLDPPRMGLGRSVVAGLGRVRAPQLRIVSCDPSTLARDLRGLLGMGYRIEEVSLVDLFPQTFHLETVVKLQIR